MKHVLRDLSVGESLSGDVQECLPGGDLIICFGGDLLRVHNETSHPFQPGECVTLVVRSIEPLGFQLIPDRAEQRRRGRIDVSV